MEMKKLIFIVLYQANVSAQINFTITSVSSSFTINCYSPSLTFSASTTHSAPVTFSWSGPGSSSVGTITTLSVPGSYTVSALSGTIQNTQTFTIISNTVVPIISLNSSTFSINGTNPATIAVSTTPTTNIEIFLYSPPASTLHGFSYTINYVLFFPGTYTHCSVNMINGCSSCVQFTVLYTSSNTAIPEPQLNANLEVFPNPTQSMFTVRSKQDQTCQLLNSMGLLLLVFVLNNDNYHEKSFRAFPPGIYFVKPNGNNNAARKVLVE
jgi:hypothetical protein